MLLLNYIIFYKINAMNSFPSASGPVFLKFFSFAFDLMDASENRARYKSAGRVMVILFIFTSLALSKLLA